MTTLLRSYDHYAPDVAATVLPGAPVPSGPYWTGTVTRRSVAAGSRIRWSDGTNTDTELVRLDEQLSAYAVLPGATDASHREVSWLSGGRLAHHRGPHARHPARDPLAVSHVYEYLLGRAGVAGHGRREFSGPLGGRYFVAGVSAVEILGAEVVDPDGRSLAGIVVPGQRFHLRGAGRRIMLRHGAVRARLLAGDHNHLVTITEQPPVVVDHILAG